MARKINVKLILELRKAGLSRNMIAATRHMSKNSVSDGSTILLGDEPTGNLDAANEQVIMNIFKKLAHEENKCVIVVTHSKRAASEADIFLTLKNGRLHIATK